MSNQVTSTTRRSRQSNFELLRILAMFMVLSLHANYLVFGDPTAETFKASPLTETGRIFLEALCICAVNVFVMISGWFGIKASLKGFCTFMFQTLFFLILTFVVAWSLGYITISADTLLYLLCLREKLWFVVSYAILYILSPVLNTFLENTNRRQLLLILLAFFAAQTYWGFIDKRPDFSNGYSALSFCGLYMLAGYLRRYATEISKWGLTIFVGSVVLMALFVTIQTGWAFPFCWFNYNDPLAITAASGLILCFSRIEMRPNNAINFVAASAFAVYLLHCSPFAFSTLFVPIIQASNSHLGLAGVILAIVVIYIMAIVLDQPRKWLWRIIVQKLFNRDTKLTT